MMKLIITIYCAISTVSSFEQGIKILRSLEINQRQFIRNLIPKEEQKNYWLTLESSIKVRSKVIKFIMNDNQSFLSKDINFMDGYNPNGSIFFGVIWNPESNNIYTYNYVNPDSINIVKKDSLSINNITEKTLINNFVDWKSKIFAHIKADMWTSNDGTYYIASKYLISNNEIKTIAFYH